MTRAIHHCNFSLNACHVFLPAMAGDDEGGLKLTYRTIQSMTNVTSPIDGNPANKYDKYRIQ
jgi:hypothetical protein